MTDPIGLAASLLALTLFTFNSCSTLYQTVKSIQNHPDTVLDLLEELGALIAVLQNLQKVVEDDSTDLEELKGPLLSCGNACETLLIAIKKRTSRSSDGKTSFRDWAKINFLGNDIAEFQGMIARYKSTIIISLCGATLRTVNATASVLDEYQSFIVKTVSSLDKYFQEKDSRLQTLAVPGASLSSEDASEREQLQKEMNTTKECLAICAKVFGDLDQVRLKIFEDICSAHGLNQLNLKSRDDFVSANRILVGGCEDWKGAVTKTVFQLQNHLFKVDSTPTTSSPRGTGLAEDAAREKRNAELDNSMKDCQKICAKAVERVEEARTNIIEDMSAAPDAFQVVVATFGDLLTARRVKAENGATQLLGQMSDVSFQKALEAAGRASHAKAQESGAQAPDIAKFEDRYGAGYKFG